MEKNDIWDKIKKSTDSHQKMLEQQAKSREEFQILAQKIKEHISKSDNKEIVKAWNDYHMHNVILSVCTNASRTLLSDSIENLFLRCDKCGSKMTIIGDNRFKCVKCNIKYALGEVPPGE